MSVRRGFTLIEIIIVIGIIALLATILLFVVSRARSGAADGVIKADLRELAGKMELEYTTNYDYGTPFLSGTCPTTSSPPDPIFYTNQEIRSMIGTIQAANGGKDVKCASGSTTGGSSAQSWAIASPLKNSDPATGPYLCIDSGGQVKVVDLGTDEFQRFTSVFIPIAYAMPPPTYPWLGGGPYSAARCP